MEIFTDLYFMKQAFRQAQLAFEQNEVPVGAVIVCNQQVISKAHNQTELLNDVTAHAEILALTSAMDALGSKYLNDCTLYITLEPCVMCAGAIYWSQIDRLVYAASDEKHGFMRFGKELIHPKTKVEFGLMYEECSQIMQEFFQLRRSKS